MLIKKPPNISIKTLFLPWSVNFPQKCIDKNNLEYGVSITDACINLETTKRLLLKVSQICNPIEIKI